MCSVHICLTDRKTPAEAVTAGVFLLEHLVRQKVCA